MLVPSIRLLLPIFNRFQTNRNWEFVCLKVCRRPPFPGAHSNWNSGDSRKFPKFFPVEKNCGSVCTQTDSRKNQEEIVSTVKWRKQLENCLKVSNRKWRKSIENMSSEQETQENGTSNSEVPEIELIIKVKLNLMQIAPTIQITFLSRFGFWTCLFSPL